MEKVYIWIADGDCRWDRTRVSDIMNDHGLMSRERSTVALGRIDGCGHEYVSGARQRPEGISLRADEEGLRRV